MKASQYISITKIKPEDADRKINKRKPRPNHYKHPVNKSLFSDNWDPSVYGWSNNPKPFSKPNDASRSLWSDTKGIPNQVSLFSNKLDPSVHGHRVKNYKAKPAEVQQSNIISYRNKLRDLKDKNMSILRKKEVVAEARDIQDIARQYSLDAMQALADILSNPESADNAKIAAANVILERGYGKAAATNLNINANMNASPKELDSRELDRRSAEIISRIERLTDGKSEEVKSKNRPLNLRDYN